ncbi:MAG: helix-turn-helix domain-containing protein [Bacteroidota bacterium]
MSLANNIKRLREEKGVLQKEVATEVGLGVSHYSKIENGQREASVELIDKLAKFYCVFMNQIAHIHMGKSVPKEVRLKIKQPMSECALLLN